jgi:hypothetical protein
MASGGTLALWFAMDFQNLRYRFDGGDDWTTGYILSGGPKTIYYTYAYASSVVAANPRAPVVVRG